MMADGHLPNFSRFKNQGSYIAEGYNLPTVTPPSWASIATGAFPRTHGVEGYYFRVEGRDLSHKQTVQGFGSAPLKAETIWDRWDGAGKKCLVLNYPVAWPGKMRNGVMVMGQGMNPAELRFLEPGNAHREFLAGETSLSTDSLSQGQQISFGPPEGWKSLPAGPSLAFSVEMDFRESVWPLKKVLWHGLAWASKASALDSLSLSLEKDFAKAFLTAPAGKWSEAAELLFDLEDGGREIGAFRAKLMELSGDASRFTLYISGISGRTGFVDPPEAASKIDFQGQIVANDIGLVSQIGGIIDPQTVVELAGFHSGWLTKVAESVVKSNPDWDLLYLHSHNIDWFYHGFLSQVDSPDPEIRSRARGWELEIYQIEDKFLGRMLSLLNDDDLAVICSDHGATPMGPIFYTPDALQAKGLCRYERKKSENYWDIYEEAEGFDYVVDLSQSAAVPQKYMHVYVNLEKYPGGIIKEDDYEKVRGQIIDALLDYHHPQTGERPVLLAVRKEDAKVFGMGGPQSGDVVYVLKPEYMAEHGYGLPTAESGCGCLRNLLMFKGPGRKKGFVYDRPRWLADIVPTICAATGGPHPADVEGAIIYQIFEDFDKR
jgi:predicted AlkP superfamily phosphohydrolase/phosphomutase